MKNVFLIYCLLFTAIFFSACEKSRVFDKNISLEKEGWFYGEKQNFEVSILDTNTTYNLYINVRHTDEYPYNNLWVNMTTVFPDSTVQENKVSVVLSESNGEWIGTCVDGICYNSVLVQSNFLLNQKGKYTISLEQDMRMNPLPFVLSIGVKLEKFGISTDQ